ncbi:MAG: hypothetical protein QN168_10680 [Armatimonadota bacterium]|nr:hypothetical protein [Armatimonadota bacterium]
MERWQLQDRLVSRLRQLGCDASPRFFEQSGGQLAFRIRIGWRPPPGLLRGLQKIDEIPPVSR